MTKYKFKWALWRNGTKLGDGHAKSEEDCELAARVRLQLIGFSPNETASLHVATKDDWSDARKSQVGPAED